jgi:AraC-like DNA-binding protein
MFCGVAMHDLPDPAIGLAELLGTEGRLLTESLAAAPDWESRFDLLDAAILRRVRRAREPTPSIEWAWRVLEASHGRVEIGRLADRIGCSPRHLIAGFHEHVGVAPKTAARILRFHRASSLVRDSAAQPLARVASECGYHDQAHMTREFRVLAGTTPAAFRAASLPGYLGIPDYGDPSGPDARACVNFVQDGGGAAI